MRIQRLTVLLAVVVLAAVTTASAADADPPEYIYAQQEAWIPGTDNGTRSGCTYEVVNVYNYDPQAWVHVLEYNLLNPSSSPLQPDGTTYAFTNEGGIERRWTYRKCPNESGTFIWAIVATPQNLAAGAFERLKELVPEPDATFEPVDSTHNWLYVQVPTDYRLPQWTPVTVVASPIPGIWSSATATPQRLIFDPGDPAHTGPLPTCGGGDVIGPFDPATPGPCSYRYLNASSTAPNGQAFNYEFTIEWLVTFNSWVGVPRPPEIITTDADDFIEVAEARPST